VIKEQHFPKPFKNKSKHSPKKYTSPTQVETLSNDPKGESQQGKPFVQSSATISFFSTTKTFATNTEISGVVF
jgi:hypothetical protein